VVYKHFFNNGSSQKRSLPELAQLNTRSLIAPFAEESAEVAKRLAVPGLAWEGNKLAARYVNIGVEFKPDTKRALKFSA